jgi:hypothetical protein
VPYGVCRSERDALRPRSFNLDPPIRWGESLIPGSDSVWGCGARLVVPPWLRGCSTFGVSWSRRCRLGGQVAAAGGPQTRVNNVVQAVCQGQPRGRWRVRRRAEDAVLAGTVISLRRMVAVVALVKQCPAMVAAARVRLNAITASTSQAALAQNFPDGRCARAEFFRSA